MIVERHEGLSFTSKAISPPFMDNDHASAAPFLSKDGFCVRPWRGPYKVEKAYEYNGNP